MPLPKVHRVVQDSLGNVVPQVLCSVLLEGTGTLATLWQDDAGTIPLSNPMTSDATYGSFGFYVEPGHYDLTFTKPGYTFQPLLDMQVPQDDLTLGTMAQQNASAVAITGGSATLSTLTTTGAVGLGRAIDPSYGLSVQGAIQTAAALNVQTQSTLNGAVGMGRAPDASYSLATAGGVQVGTGLTVLGSQGIGSAPVATFKQAITYNKTNETALRILPTTSDAGGGLAVQFLNVAAAMVGSITTTGAATAYNTSSDARLKKDVTPLTGALDVVRRLRPITHLWRADDSRGYGFVAHEVQDTLPADAGVVTGERDAIDEVGNILPQMIDYSKLVPFLVGAINTLSEQVESLTARIAVLSQ